MAASSYGDANRSKKPKKNRTYGEKLAARTTESSKARFRAKHPRHGGGGNDHPPKPADPLMQRADELTKLRYGGAESDLNQRGVAIPSWFQNYQNQITAAQGQAQTYAAPILQQSQARAQAAGQTAPGVDPNSEAGKQATLAAAARAALESSFTTMLQGYGQIQNDYMAGRKTVGATAQIGAQNELARDRSDLQRDKGLYRSTTVEDLRDKKHTQDLENKAFGLDVVQEQNDQANAAADRKASARDKNQSVNKYGYSEKAWRAMSTAQRQKIIRQFDSNGGSGGSGQFTATQRQKTKADIRKGIHLIQGKLKGKSSAPASFWSQALDALINEKDYDPAIARVIVQLLRDGKVRGGLAQTIKRDYGVTHFPKVKRAKVPAPYTPPRPTDTPGASPTLPRNQQPG